MLAVFLARYRFELGQERRMRASTREDDPPFYRPYRWAAADFELGLRPFNPNRWISIEAAYAANLRERRERLAECPDQYYRALPSSLPAQRELHACVVAHLLRDHSDRFVAANPVVKSLDTGLNTIRAIRPTSP